LLLVVKQTDGPDPKHVYLGRLTLLAVFRFFDWQTPVCVYVCVYVCVCMVRACVGVGVGAGVCSKCTHTFATWARALHSAYTRNDNLQPNKLFSVR
jgi:hypothetical protein